MAFFGFVVNISVRASASLGRAKPSFFGQMLNFSGSIQHPKMKKKLCLYLLYKKRNSFCPAKLSAWNLFFY